MENVLTTAIEEQPGAPLIDLDEAEQALLKKASKGGGRHTSVYSDDRIGMVLFFFDAGEMMPDHGAPALATIHVLKGHLQVSAAGQVYELRTGAVLVLEPKLRHSMRALETSTMLLTVHR